MVVKELFAGRGGGRLARGARSWTHLNGSAHDRLGKLESAAGAGVGDVEQPRAGVRISRLIASTRSRLLVGLPSSSATTSSGLPSWRAYGIASLWALLAHSGCLGAHLPG